MLKHPLAYTSLLMSQYKITLKSTGDPAQIQFNITNSLQKQISIATLDVLRHLAKTDIRILKKQDKHNFKNIIQSARPSLGRIHVALLKAFTQIHPIVQNIQDIPKEPRMYKIITWKGWYFARQHASPLGNDI
jgi:hypothetical protein